MSKGILIIILVLATIVKCVEWHKKTIFFAVNVEQFENLTHSSLFSSISTKAVIVKNLSSGQCSESNIGSLIELAKASKIKVVIDVQNCFDDDILGNLKSSHVNQFDQNFVRRFKTFVKHWMTKDVDGFKLDVDHVDEDSLTHLIQDFEDILRDSEEKLILIEFDGDFLLKSLPKVKLIHNEVNLNILSSDIGWILRDNMKHDKGEAFNYVKILLPGFLVIDENFNIDDYSKFFDLRNKEKFSSKGSKETIKLEENFLAFKLEVEVEHESFVVIANLAAEKIKLELNSKSDIDVFRKVVTTSSALSALKEG